MSHLTHPLSRALLAATLAALAACSPGTKDKSSDDKKTGEARGFNAPPSQAGDASMYQPIIEPGVPLGIGFGVDLNNHTGIPNKCVEGTVEDVPQQEGFLAIDADFTRTDIERSLGISSSGSVKFLKWGGSASGSYAQKLRERSYGLNYIVVVYNIDHSKVFIPTGRSEAWKTASKEEWLASCGAGYVAAQDYGSKLIINFSLQLEDKEEEKSWGAGASGNYLSLAKLKASISSNTKSKKAKGKLALSAFQRGGKPSELGKILKTDAEKGLIENFAMCDVSEVEKCLEGLRSIENYIANVFPKQIDDKENGGSAVLRTYPFLYPKNVGADFNPGLDQFVIKARKDLTDLYEAEMDDLTTLKAFAKQDDDHAQSMIQKATENVSAIRSATELCYQTSRYKECAKRAEELAIACAETEVPESFGVGDSGKGNEGNESGE